MIKRPILKGKRVYIRPIERGDLSNRVEIINDPDVQDTLNFDFPTSLSKTEAWFSKNILSSNRIDFTICLLNDDTVIGFCGFVNCDRVTRKGELYIFIGRPFWVGGYGRDVYKILTNYGFIEMGLERIYGFQLGHNKKAMNSVTKIGWSVEGCLRQDVWSHGLLKDRYVVSILRNEWIDNPVYDEV